MVKIYSILVSVLLLATSSAYAVKVTAELDSNAYSSDDAITGTITISHALNEKVNPKSFEIDDKPLQVQFLQDIKISSDVQASLYRFTLPAQEVGLHTLPEIRVAVNSKKYNSVATTYVVRTGTGSNNASTPTPVSQNTPSNLPIGSNDVVLKLEATVDGPTTLFPGQRTKLVYRYYFSGNIELNQETLPLLTAEGFKKIGQQEIKDAQSSNLGARQIIQEVQAIKPGTFTMGPSIIAGRAYQQDAQGNRSYIGTPLKAEAPAITLTVKAFDKKNKPTGFNGSIGDFSAISTRVLSPTDVVLGDAVTISVAIQGKGDLTSALLPDLCCLPGFSGRFRASDIPAMEETDGDTKYFVTQLKPLSTSIKEIPSIPFTFFNPDTGQYVSLKSDPVPINVKKDPLGVTDAPEYQGEQVEWPREPVEKKETVPTPQVIAEPETETNWFYYLLLPLAAIALWVLLRSRSPLAPTEQPRSISSQGVDSNQLMTQAYQAQKDPSRFHSLVAKALLKTLEEQGEILSADAGVESLSEFGLSQEVKSFLNRINDQRYSGKDAEKPAQILQEAALLRKKIQQADQDNPSGTANQT